jgi:hypothetical protein
MRACIDRAPAGDSTDALIRFSHVEDAGTYAGTIIGAGSAGETVRLVVRASDFVLWPILVLAIGIVLATLSKHYIGVGRPVLELRRRVLSLADLFALAETEFARTARPPTGHALIASTLSIKGDFDRRRETLKQAIEAVPRPLVGTFDASDPRFKELLDAANRLENAAQRWAAFGATLADVDGPARALITAARAVPDPVPASRRSKPQSVQRLRVLLRAGALDVDQLDSQQAAIEGQRALFVGLSPQFVRHARAVAWAAALQQQRAMPGQLTTPSVAAPSLAGAAAATRDQLLAELGAQPAGAPPPVLPGAPARATEPTDEALAVAWAPVESQLREVALDLWDIATAEDFTTRQPASALLGVERALVTAQLPTSRRDMRLSAVTADDKAAAAAAALRHGKVMQTTHSVAHIWPGRGLRVTDHMRARTLGQRIRAADWFFMTVTFLVALLAWLPANYLKQPFGTVGDYIGALVWGFGTNITVDVLSSVLSKLRTLGGVNLRP